MRHLLYLGLLSTMTAWAGSFTLSSQSADVWTYTLTYDPLDNYQPPLTLTLTGLTGVTAAGVPTSTDFLPGDPYNNAANLLWSVKVQNGGTTVQWTLTGGGTGNYGVAKHVYGFTVTAPGAQSGQAAVASSGLGVDGWQINRDFAASVTGPTSAGASAGVPEPASLSLLAVGLAALGWRARRR